MSYRAGGHRFRNLPMSQKQTKAKATARSEAKKVVKSLAEKRWHTHSAAAVNITNSGAIIGAIFDPAQGSAYDQRTGSIVQPVSLEVRAAIEQNNAAVQRQSVRCMLIQAKPGQTLPAAATMPGFLGNVTPDQKSRFNILMDKVITLNENGAAAPVRKQFHLTVKRGFNKCKWDAGSSGAVVPDDGGALAFYYCSDVGASYPTITYNTLTRYSDL